MNLKLFYELKKEALEKKNMILSEAEIELMNIAIQSYENHGAYRLKFEVKDIKEYKKILKSLKTKNIINEFELKQVDQIEDIKVYIANVY